MKNYSPDIVHIHSTDLERFAFFKVMFDNEIPLITTIHGLYSFDENFCHAYDVTKLENTILNKLNRQNKHIIFVSNGARDYAIHKFGLKDSNLHVIPNGVNRKNFKKLNNFNKEKILKKYNIPRGKKIIIQVGKLYKIKNHMVVLEAINEMKPDLRNKIHYLVVGDGLERSSLEKFSNDHNIGNVCSFVGAKFACELVELYNISDFVIVPSTSENFPLVFLEALSMGLPIITFKDLWPVEDFFNEEYMELIHDRNTDAIIDSIERTVKKSWERDKIISISKNYSWEKISERHINIFKNQLIETN